MARLNYDFKKSYVVGGIGVVLVMISVILLSETNLHPGIWISVIFILFLLLQFLGIFRPKITCSECDRNLYSAVEAEYKRTKSQAFNGCPECGAKFDESKNSS